MVHKVLLRANNFITKNSGLLDIDPHNCENYANDKVVMSRFLFLFFFNGWDIMFDSNSYARNSLINYETEQNGLGFLEDLIRDSHPELRTDVHRSSITDAFTLPTFTEDISVWQYINQMQIHFKEVNKTTPQINILRLIHDQLKLDSRFKTASEHLQDKISKYKSGNGFVPPEYRLNKIARTIMDQYSLREWEKLSEPRQKTIRAVEINVSRMSTRSTSGKGYQGQQYRQTPSAPTDDNNYIDRQPSQKMLSEYGADNSTTAKEKTVKFQKPPPSNKLCKGCFTYGHDVEDCTKTGAAISISQFLCTCTPERKQQILEAYKQNQKEAHERYINAYQRQRKLKQHIKSIEYDLQFDEQNQRWKDLSAQELHSLDTSKIACVVDAKKENFDIDFGLLDANYEDLTKPQLEFNPDTDNIPGSEWSSESDILYQEGERQPKDQDWLERITILLNEYDSILSQHNKETILEKPRQPPDKEFIVESAWIQWPINYTDDQNSDELTPEELGLRYRYHLHMKNLQANRVGMNLDKPFLPVKGLTEGNDWQLNDQTGEW